MPDWVVDPTKFKRVNGWLTVIWFFAAFPIMVFLSKSVEFLVFISTYAIVTGHLSTWQSTRVEERQELDDDVSQVSVKVDELREEII